ncbi:hypothetical protein ABBQ38_000764 [Trebouxia sp. C0009 RCD-2024]
MLFRYAALVYPELPDGKTLRTSLVQAICMVCADNSCCQTIATQSVCCKVPTYDFYHVGLPFLVKDLTAVNGLPFTRTTVSAGQPHLQRPSNDALVDVLEDSGANVLGKTNTPEFGAGANTFNDIFGKTCNPWDTNLTPGGSSGGSAAAVAAGQVWLATGTDLGGSLRIPASFCEVVGLRPSVGGCPRTLMGKPPLWASWVHSVSGPLARPYLTWHFPGRNGPSPPKVEQFLCSEDSSGVLDHRAEKQ